METFQGYVPTVKDALLLFEAVVQNQLLPINRRLSNTERRGIKSGSVFVFEEGNSGVQRWTDGYQWSPSRLQGNFLTYYQKQYLPGSLPLIKRTLSVVTSNMRKFVLVSYYNNQDLDNGLLRFPSQDLKIAKLSIPDNFYFRRITQQNSGTSAILTPLSGKETTLSTTSRFSSVPRSRSYTTSHPYIPYSSNNNSLYYTPANRRSQLRHQHLPTLQINASSPESTILRLSSFELHSSKSRDQSSISPVTHTFSLALPSFMSSKLNASCSEDRRQLNLFDIKI